MKILRAVSLTFAFLTPALALATPPLPACCTGTCCPGCPLCHHAT